MGLAILIGVFILGLVVGVPVAVTLGLASVAYLLFEGIPLVSVPQKMYAAWTSSCCSAFRASCLPAT
jgi:hypothetical protein